jgi:hypothetical protein
MSDQDWTTVVIKKRTSKKEQIRNGQTTIQARDPEKNEKIRMAKLDNAEGPDTKKRINPESLQTLIRKRIELKLNQEKADMLCAFSRHTFRDIESNRLMPSEDHKRRIQQHLGIQLKIDTIST